MTATLTPPPIPGPETERREERAPVVGSPRRDVPWPPQDEIGPAGLSTSVAVTFVIFGLVAMMALGVVLGRVGLPSASRGATSSAAGNVAAKLEVTASEFKFTPGALAMDGAGELTVNLKNAGAVEHDFSIEGVQGKAYAKAGGTATATFKIGKAGTYTFFCAIPGHKEAGMKGTLTVGPAAAAAAPQAATQPAAGATAQPVVQPAVSGAKPLPAPQIAPPVNRTQPATVKVDLETKEVTAVMAEGVTYKYWTFNGTVPGPMVRVRQGDTVELTLKNAADSQVTHSIDLHAVTGPGGGAKVMQVPVGGSASFRFQALNPGVYVYHCATPMVAHHIANGMYGLIVVEPEAGLPKVDHEFYVMQGDFYVNGQRGQKGNMDFSLEKMLDERPDYVLFNGGVGNVTGANALQAKVGDTVRIFFGVGGPNLTSSFHVIGEIFDKVYPEGAMGPNTQPLTNVQTTHVSTGGATVVEFKVEVPGDYILVDHSLGRLEKGAAGILHVEGDPNPAIFEPLKAGAAGSGGH